MTILAACGKDEYAGENAGHGVFTDLLVEALYGGAMNLLGEVSPGSIYSYVDQSLGCVGTKTCLQGEYNILCFTKKKYTSN